MKKSIFTKWYVKYLLILACIGILVIVPLLRPMDAGRLGSETYLNLRLAENPSVHDELSFGGRFATYEWGTPLVLSIAPYILVDTLPLLLGIASFILLWLIIRKLHDDPKIEKISLILLLLSPTFIYLFSSANSFHSFTFQMRAVPSNEALTNSAPSVLNASNLTVFVCPARTSRSWPPGRP